MCIAKVPARFGGRRRNILRGGVPRLPYRDASRLGSYVDGPRLARIGWGYGDRIACAHMSGLRLGLRPLAKMGFANSEIQTRERHLLPVNRAETLPVRLAPITPPLPILQVPASASDLPG